MLRFDGHSFDGKARCLCCVDDKKAVTIIDPTGTTKLRLAFRSEFNRRWGQLRVAVRAMLIDRDVLGLKPSGVLQVVMPGITMGATRQESFAAWMDFSLRSVVYQSDGMWMDTYFKRAWDQGTKFGQEQANTTLVNRDSQHRFDAIRQLARSEVQGIMSAVLQQAVRIVALGIATQQKPIIIVRGIWAAIDKTGGNRSQAMINLMIVKAFGDATLDVYQAVGIAKVGLIPETAGRVTDAQTQSKAKIGAKDAKARTGPGSRSSRSAAPSRSTIGRIRRAELNVAKRLGESVNVRTAGDDAVCPVCEAISENGPYSINRARTLIPAHPHCRCVFVPAHDRRFASDTLDMLSSSADELSTAG